MFHGCVSCVCACAFHVCVCLKSVFRSGFHMCFMHGKGWRVPIERLCVSVSLVGAPQLIICPLPHRSWGYRRSRQQDVKASECVSCVLFLHVCVCFMSVFRECVSCVCFMHAKGPKQQQPKQLNADIITHHHWLGNKASPRMMLNETCAVLIRSMKHGTT